MKQQRTSWASTSTTTTNAWGPEPFVSLVAVLSHCVGKQSATLQNINGVDQRSIRGETANPNQSSMRIPNASCVCYMNCRNQLALPQSNQIMGGPKMGRIARRRTNGRGGGKAAIRRQQGSRRQQQGGSKAAVVRRQCGGIRRQQDGSKTAVKRQ
jgi:hypothetical protein